MMVHSDAGALEDLMTLELAIKLALVWEVDEREPPGLLESGPTALLRRVGVEVKG